MKANHPLAEILEKKLSGIETVSAKEQKRMISIAIKVAVEYHEERKCQCYPFSLHDVDNGNDSKIRDKFESECI